MQVVKNSMARMIAVVLAVSLASAAALVARSELDQVVAMSSKGQMRPDVVSKMLVNIENTWRAQAYAFTECKTTGEDFNCKQAPKAFLSSCEKVGDVVFLASSGHVEESKEYMNDVCGSSHIGDSWHRSTCELVSKAMLIGMSVNAEYNRNHASAHTKKACTGLWDHFVEEQKKVNEKAEKEEEEHEKSVELAEEKREKEHVKLAEEHRAEPKKEKTAEPKEVKKVDLSKPMPLKAQEQGFEGKKVQHKDGKTMSKDWRKEYGADRNGKEEKKVKKSASIQSMASVAVLVVAAVLQLVQ